MADAEETPAGMYRTGAPRQILPDAEGNEFARKWPREQVEVLKSLSWIEPKIEAVLDEYPNWTEDEQRGGLEVLFPAIWEHLYEKSSELPPPDLEPKWMAVECKASTNNTILDALLFLDQVPRESSAAVDVELARAAARYLDAERREQGLNHGVIRVAMRLGQLLERIASRGYQQDVMTGQKRRKASAKGGRASGKVTDDDREALQGLYEKRRGDGVSRTATLKRVAADFLKEHGKDIDPKTVGRHLKKLDNS